MTNNSTDDSHPDKNLSPEPTSEINQSDFIAAIIATTSTVMEKHTKRTMIDFRIFWAIFVALGTFGTAVFLAGESWGRRFKDTYEASEEMHKERIEAFKDEEIRLRVQIETYAGIKQKTDDLERIILEINNTIIQMNNLHQALALRLEDTKASGDQDGPEDPTENAEDTNSNAETHNSHTSLSPTSRGELIAFYKEIELECSSFFRLLGTLRGTSGNSNYQQWDQDAQSNWNPSLRRALIAMFRLNDELAKTIKTYPNIHELNETQARVAKYINNIHMLLEVDGTEQSGNATGIMVWPADGRFNGAASISRPKNHFSQMLVFWYTNETENGDGPLPGDEVLHTLIR